MGEHIPLRSFSKNKFQQSDSEEYHEIGHEALEETLLSPKRPVTPIKEIDFFTMYDTGKRSTKKKKRRKDRKTKSITDLINSELASKGILIENNIVIVDTKERDDCLKKLTRIQPIFKSIGSRNVDAENGFNRHFLKTDQISPVFPRVLENNISKETTIPYIEPSLFSDVVSEHLESGTKQSPKFFDIIIKSIKFKHHHEFSLENLCSLKLVEYYKKYESTANLLKELIRQIDVNRRTAISLKEKLTKVSPNRKEEIRYDKNILKYTKTMLNLKEKYYRTLDDQKDNIHRTMSLWADIELIRLKSGNVRTDLFLEVCSTEIEQNEFETQWNQAFEVEYSDMILKIEHDFTNSYLEYKELKRTSNEQNKITKPRLEIDYDKLKETVESLVNSMILKKNIKLLLKRDRTLISSANNSRKTSFVNNYCFKIYIDDLFVCETDSYSCKVDQSVIDFIEHLSIEILPNNKSLSIVLFENNEEMASLQIKLSDIKKNSIETSLKNTFVFNKTEEPSSRCIGSGYDIKEIAAKNKVRLKSSNLFRGKLTTSCDVNIQLGWNYKYYDNQLESITSHMDIGRQIKHLLIGKNEPSLNNVTEIINALYNTRIEDNHIMTALKEICEGKLNIDNNFNFNKNDAELTRLKLLHLRSTGGLLDVDNKSVPLFTSQMSTELLSCLEKSQQTDLVYQNIKKDTDNTIEVQRFIGIKFIDKLNKSVMKKVNDYLLKISYKDVVRDYEELSLRAMFTNQTHLTLGGISSASNRTLIKDCLLTEQDIYITIYKAYNLICRQQATLTEDQYDSDSNIAGFKVHALRPFVQVSYHGITAKTVTAIGRHPSWNQTLKIRTRLDPLSSIHINIYDECKEHLDKMYSDDQSQSTVIYRKFNKWIGTVNVPLHSVLSLGNVRGTFKLSAPPLLFGYENSPLKQPGSKISELSRLMKKESSFIAVQVSTSMSHLGGMETYRQPIANDSEADFVIRHLNEFVTEYTKEFPARNISLTFIDSTGKNKCVSEFLQAIPVPDYDCFPIDPKKTESARSKSSGYSKSSSSKSSRKKSSNDDKESVNVDTWKGGENHLMKYVDAVVRYVSLIPTYELVEPYVVTLMGVELLKVLYGSPLDHTILLASFFLHLEIKCWIVICYGLPRGMSSYVMVQYYHNKILKRNDETRTTAICGGSEGFAWYIYDAVAGDRHELREIGCPLKTVSYVFDSENIWANVQSAQDCESISFNFSKSSEWQSVFNKPLFITRPISDNLFSKPEDIESLRETLETKIKNKIQKWRSHVKTIWNRYGSTLMREMLPHWEYWSFNPSEIQPNPGNRLKQFMATYKMYGFPLNMPYLNSKLIISRIKSTAIHINDDPNVEFGLGVEVYSYPNNVLSVWVFLASITRI